MKILTRCRGGGVQVVVRDSSNNSRIAQVLGTNPGSSTMCLVSPGWSDTGMQAIEVAVMCGSDNTSVCPVLVDFRTSCSAGERKA